MGVMNLLPCAEVIPIRRRLVAVIQLVCQIVSTEHRWSWLLPSSALIQSG
jgi:hypothetical protein